MPRLRALDADIKGLLAYGRQFKRLMFTIPGKGPFIIPFDGPSFQSITYDEHGELLVDHEGNPRPYCVWGVVSGTTIDDLTLSPSYLCHITDPLTGKRRELLHGHVINGSWNDCG